MLINKEVDSKKGFSKHVRYLYVVFLFWGMNGTMGSVSFLLVSNRAASEGFKTLLYQCISSVLFCIHCKAQGILVYSTKKKQQPDTRNSVALYVTCGKVEQSVKGARQRIAVIKPLENLIKLLNCHSKSCRCWRLIECTRYIRVYPKYSRLML
jgi:hypothetical protein